MKSFGHFCSMLKGWQSVVVVVLVSMSAQLAFECSVI